MILLYYFSFEKSISNYHLNVYFIIYFAHYFIIVLKFEKQCAIISNEIKAERGSTMQRIVQFIKAQPVLVIAFFAAALTVILVPPDTQYAGYVNTRVLIQLFGLMAAVAGVRAIGVFDAAAAMLLRRAGTIRRLGLILTLIFAAVRKRHFASSPAQRPRDASIRASVPSTPSRRKVG